MVDDTTTNPEHPYSGLTLAETRELEAAGWTETSFETMPPPWKHRDMDALYSPREALVIARHIDVTTPSVAVQMPSRAEKWRLTAIELEGRVEELKAALAAKDAEIARLTEALATSEQERRETQEQCDGLMSSIERIAWERDEARAILAGRTTAPTDEEIAAHEAAGGSWRVIASGPIRRATGRGALTYWDMTLGGVIPRLMEVWSEGDPRCWPLDADGRPCAWPVVGDTR